MFRYTGTGGAHYIGIPARDLTPAEFEALDKTQQAAVKSGNLYAAVAEPKDLPAQEAPKEDAPKGKK